MKNMKNFLVGLSVVVTIIVGVYLIVSGIYHTLKNVFMLDEGAATMWTFVIIILSFTLARLIPLITRLGKEILED